MCVAKCSLSDNLGRCGMAERERHPWSLKWLFGIEHWERFGFYTMLGILALFLMDTAKGGYGLDKKSVGSIVGTFIALVYMTPFLGAMLAERVLGLRKTILIGAFTLAAGYFMLAFTESKVLFYSGLGVIALGNGLFKPNISALLGKFYSDDSKLVKSAFNIFYMGINIAGLTCNFVAAYLRHNYTWGTAFAGAGVGMTIAVLMILLIYKRLGPIDEQIFEQMRAKRDPNEVGFAYLGKWVLPPLALLAAFGYWIGGMTWAYLLACIPIIVFYYRLWATAKVEERGPMGALLVLFIAIMPFFTIYGMSSTALTFWAEENTERQIDTPVINWTLDTFQFADEVDSSSPYFNATETKADIPSMITATPQEGQKVKLVSAELFQSLNPFFVVTIIPLLEFLMAFLRRRKKEPSTPVQLGIGLLIAAFSMLVMYAAVKASYTNGSMVKVTAWWLVFAYFFSTAAEVFVSPTGLALVRQMSPKRFTAVMMGGWFIIASSIGMRLAGLASGLWETISHEALFLGLFAFAGLAALLVFALSGWLNQYIPKSS